MQALNFLACSFSCSEYCHYFPQHFYNV